MNNQNMQSSRPEVSHEHILRTMIQDQNLSYSERGVLIGFMTTPPASASKTALAKKTGGSHEQ